MEKNSFGTRMYLARKQKNVSQKQLAALVGTSIKNINRWELDQNVPSVEFARKIAVSLEVSLDYLAGLVSDSPVTNDDIVLFNLVEQLTVEQKKALIVLLGR